MIKKKRRLGRGSPRSFWPRCSWRSSGRPGLAETKNVCQAALERCLADALAGMFGGLVGIIGSLSSCLSGTTSPEVHHFLEVIP